MFFILALCSPLLSWAQPLREKKKLDAFEMVIIQAVSHTAKTFVTKHGKQDGYVEGQEVSFNTENIAVVARAKLVTREFTVWEVVEPNGIIPFEKGKIVVMNRAKENIWELIPKQEKQVIYKNGMIARGSLGTGLVGTVSNVDVGYVNRNLAQVDLIYDRILANDFSLGLGGRYERQTQSSQDITVLTDRLYGLVEGTYHFPRHESLYETHLYATLSFGLGLSRSDVDGDKQIGYCYLLPGFKLGLEHETSRRTSFLVEAGLESVFVREYLIYRGKQDSNEINGKFAVGFKTYY